MVGKTYSFTREYDPSSGAYLYLFVSRRGNRSIPKAVIYAPEESDRKYYYNVGFGDLIVDTETGEFIGLDDLAESNNGDVVTIFNTVVETFADFFSIQPMGILYFEGSNQQRMNVYRSLISRHWHDITKLYEVWGIIDNGKEIFKAGVLYHGILFCKREVLYLFEDITMIMFTVIKDTPEIKELRERLARELMAKIQSGEIDPFKEKRERAWESLRRMGLIK